MRYQRLPTQPRTVLSLAAIATLAWAACGSGGGSGGATSGATTTSSKSSASTGSATASGTGTGGAASCSGINPNSSGQPCSPNGKVCDFGGTMQFEQATCTNGKWMIQTMNFTTTGASGATTSSGSTTSTGTGG